MRQRSSKKPQATSSPKALRPKTTDSNTSRRASPARGVEEDGLLRQPREAGALIERHPDRDLRRGAVRSIDLLGGWGRKHEVGAWPELGFDLEPVTARDA